MTVECDVDDFSGGTNVAVSRVKVSRKDGPHVMFLVLHRYISTIERNNSLLEYSVPRPFSPTCCPDVGRFSQAPDSGRPIRLEWGVTVSSPSVGSASLSHHPNRSRRTFRPRRGAKDSN